MAGLADNFQKRQLAPRSRGLRFDNAPGRAPVVEKKAFRRESGAWNGRLRLPQSRRRFCGDKRGSARQARTTMITLVTAILGALVAALRPRASLVVENLAL